MSDDERTADNQPMPGEWDEEALLRDLNESQRRAVTTTEGYVRVIAGAGSGKTKTLTHRFAYLVNELGISPSNILCVTFTNKAAREMKNRVGRIVDMGSVNDFICTYHGFCVKILREDISKIAYPKSFIIMDVEDQKTVLREIYEELGIRQTDITFDNALSYIGYRKHTSPFIAQYIDIDTSQPLEPVPDDADLLMKCFLRYVQKQRKSFMLDFDDLMLFAMYIFRKSPDVLAKWQERLDYIMVDETQDNSAMQWQFVEMLQATHKNLFVVGDPDQCIYEWRGARPETLVNFDKVFAPCTAIILDQNYRSTPNILNVANSVIAYNRNRVAKNLFTCKPPASTVTHFHGKSEAEEGQYIAQTIKKYLEGGGKPSDVAILFRASHVSRFIEQALVKNKIPYVVYGGVRFFERQEIKDVLAYLRLVDTGDDLSFLRIVNQPRRKLGKVFLSGLKALARIENGSLYTTLLRHIGEREFSKTGALEFVELVESARDAFKKMTLSDATQFLLEKSRLMELYRTDGDQDRVDNLNELIASMREYEKANENEEDLSLTRYLQDIALYTNLDYKKDSDNVKIMTIHQSKGLEFPIVFVAGMQEGLFPNHRSIREYKRRGLEEERRLAYVACTRAEKLLYLTESEGYNYQNGSFKFPSRFIFEIKQNLLVRQGVLTKELERQAKNFIERTTLEMEIDETNADKEALTGSRVEHKVFGAGTIINVDDSSQSLTIRFDTTGAAKHFSLNQIGKSLKLKG